MKNLARQPVIQLASQLASESAAPASHRYSGQAVGVLSSVRLSNTSHLVTQSAICQSTRQPVSQFAFHLVNKIGNEQPLGGKHIRQSRLFSRSELQSASQQASQPSSHQHHTQHTVDHYPGAKQCLISTFVTHDTSITTPAHSWRINTSK